MPLREIPIQTAAFKQTPHSPGAPKNPITPTDFQATSLDTKALVSGIAALPNPFASETNVVIAETRVLLRTEEEQQAAAREREAKGNLEMEDDNKRSEARRKSLANRRVSFAPEATLHTWDVVEYLQDSTTSSASTNSTRWASSTSAGTPDSPQLESQSPPSPGTAKQQNISSEPIEGPLASSTHQHDSIQKRRRRSSTIPPLNFNNPHDELFTSSPSSDGSTAGDENDNQLLSNGDSDDISDSNSNSDDEGTAMSLDTGDNTDMSVKSNTSSNGSSARLDEALKEATQRAEIQRAGINENMGLGIAEKGEVSLEQLQSKASSIQSLISSNDQENLNSYSPAFKSVIQHDDGMSVQLTQVGGQKFSSTQSEDETAMEMTAAIGGIISAPQTNSANKRRKSGITVGRQSLRRRTSVASLGDDTMDLTAVIGGIQQTVNEVNATEDGQNEDMTMELTSVIGGVLASNSAPASKYKTPSTTRSQPLENRKRQSAISIIGDDAMDMTLAIGGILTEDVPSTASDDNTTIGMVGGILTEDVPSTASDDNTAICMEMTTALGAILPKQPSTGKRKTRYGMDEQANRDSPLQATPTSSQGRVQANTITSETGSPSLASKGKGLRRSIGPRSSTTPKSMKTADTEAPTTKPLTPVKQFTPKLSKLASPKIKFPNTVKQSTASSESLFKDSAKIESSKSTPNKLFQRDITTGIATPSIILTPQKRSPGLIFDRAKLGSPRFTDLLDRRRSLSDISPVFTFGETGEIKHGVRFDDPQVIEQELDKERQAEMDREDGRKIMEWEADTAETEKDATLNLKEMIESLTPKKRPLKGRKSLHVGTAKGILGKRPVELDEDDEETDEDLDGVERLKNHQGSPVKSVKLQAPPSKAETTRRITRATRRSLETVSGNLITPTTTTPLLDGSMATTPKGQSRFKVVDSLFNPQQAVPFIQKAPIEDPIPNEEAEEAERMHLQDFLNLTSIRFMELTTTKRRHTIAPNGMQKDVSSKHNSDAADQSFESCVVAGACTVPMLELFQHVRTLLPSPPPPL
jgi:kinetochore protein Spc7/SPC105